MFKRKSWAWFINEGGKVEFSPHNTPRYENEDAPAVRGILIDYYPRPLTDRELCLVTTGGDDE